MLHSNGWLLLLLPATRYHSNHTAKPDIHNSMQKLTFGKNGLYTFFVFFSFLNNTNKKTAKLQKSIISQGERGNKCIIF